MDRPQRWLGFSEIENAVGALDFISIERVLIETPEYILQSRVESVKAGCLNDSQMAASG